MKFFAAVVLFAVILSGQNFSQVTGLGNTDPHIFTRYKLPETTVKQFTISGNTNLSSTRRSDNYSTGESSFYNMNLQPYYMYLKESDDRVFSISAYLSGGLNHSTREDNINPANSSKSSGSDQNLRVSVTPSMRMYTSSEGNLFYSLNTDLWVNMNYSKMKQSSTSQPERYYASGGKYQNYTVNAGIGWGRLRNVTPVVNAIRFQERLKVLNKINSDLPKDDIIALSGQFARYGSYTSVFDRPEKYFYKDLDNVLSSRNISLGDMNLYSAAYLLETLTEVKFIRFEGFRTEINLMLDYDNSYNMYENQPNPRNSTLTEQLITGLRFSAEYSHQLDLYSQFSVYLNASGGPNVLTRPNVRQSYNVSLTPSYSRELTDRFTITASNTAYYILRNAASDLPVFSNDLRIRFNYFIEDNIYVSADYSWRFEESTYNNNSQYEQNNYEYKNIISSHGIWLGVTYALQNSLNLF